MRIAIDLAKHAGNFTHPNPLVGAVIVKDGRIIGRGAHERAGSLHAERNALASCTENPKGADIYVTLEPCCHYGKQPPCTKALIDAGIKRCYIGSNDPNPLVSGKGIKQLEKAGIDVFTGLLTEECDRLNTVFFHYIRRKRPFVTLKYAMTIDGKIASRTDESQWITGEKARNMVAASRSKHMAILTSISTVLKDNPFLTAHGKSTPDPIRIIVDSKLRTPLDSNLVNDFTRNPDEQENILDVVSFDEKMRYPRTIIATCVKTSERWHELKEKGAVILTLPADRRGHVSLPALLDKLGELEIDSVYTECGAELLGSLIDEHLADAAEIYIAPKLLGSAEAKCPVGGLGFTDPNKTPMLKNVEVTKVDGDLCVTGLLAYPDDPEAGKECC